MNARGADADLGAEAELVAVVQPRGRVDHHRAGIHLAEEAERPGIIVRHDRFGVAGAIAGDVFHRLLHALHHLDRQNQREEFPAVILRRGRVDLRTELAGLRAAPHVHLGLLQFPNQLGQPRARDRLVDQQGLHRVAGGGTLHFGVQTNPFCHRRIGVGIHIDMADAFIVLDHGNRGLLRHRLHERVAAARDDEIHVPILLEQRQHHLAVGPLDEGDPAGRHAGLLGRFGQHGGNGRIRMNRLGPAAQDTGIPGFEAQRRRVGGHVRAGLINDPDHTDRHPHPPHLHAVRPSPQFDRLPDRIRQLDDLPYPVGHLGDSLRSEAETIRHRLLLFSCPERLQIALIRR